MRMATMQHAIEHRSSFKALLNLHANLRSFHDQT
jgi:hypothetical protein